MFSKARKKTNYGIIATALLLCAALLFGSSGILFASTTVSVTNEFQTGLVNIDLTQYDAIENGELVTNPEQFVRIMPGQTMYRTARVQNKAAACYIRLSQEFDGEDIISLNIKGDNWVQAEDGYYYYTKVLREDAYTDLGMTFHFDENAGNEYQSTEYHQNIRVEAIQSVNFTPDFASANPWGDVPIINAIYETGHKNGSVGTQSLNIMYQGESQKLITDVEDAFMNFATLMPGDSYSDTLNLNNDSDNTVMLYFKATVPDDTNKLYDALRLKITCRYDGSDTEEVIYDGTVTKSAIDTMELVELDAGKSAHLDYTLYFPEEYDNQYTLMDGDITWIFSTEEIFKEPDRPDDDAKTGDDTIMAFQLAAGGVICVVLAVILKKKDKENYQEA